MVTPMPRNQPAPLTDEELRQAMLAIIRKVNAEVLAMRCVPESPLQPAPLDAPDAGVNPDYTIRGILPTSLEWYDILFDEDELPPHARVNPDGTIRGVK